MLAKQWKRKASIKLKYIVTSQNISDFKIYAFDNNRKITL